MRTFYIFKVNKEYYNLTKNIPYNLYNAYLNIRLSTKNNLNLLYNEYFSFTEAFNKIVLNDLLYKTMVKLDGYTVYNNIHHYNNFYTDEVSKLTIYNSYMVLKSNINNSSFFTELSKIPNLFVIDFDRQDYFWLSTLKNLRLVN
jgi:hypothetical protein